MLGKPTENLDPAGRTQDLPDADCLLTFKQTNPNGSPHCAVEKLQTFGADILVTVRWDDQQYRHFSDCPLPRVRSTATFC